MTGLGRETGRKRQTPPPLSDLAASVLICANESRIKRPCGPAGRLIVAASPQTRDPQARNESKLRGSSLWTQDLHPFRFKNLLESSPPWDPEA